MLIVSSCTSVILPAAVVVTDGTSLVPTRMATNVFLAGARLDRFA
jgi:hypothetical protein